MATYVIPPKGAYAGMWDFHGACAPILRYDGTYIGGQGKTFTLGCFQWERRARSFALKPGKVQHRIKGMTDDPAPAFDAAKAFCAKKNDPDHD